MKTLCAGAVLLLGMSFTFPARAELYPVSFDQRSAMSERVVVGEVIRQHTFLVPERGVMTASTVQVKAWLKGVSDESEVIVLSLGGVFEDRATIAKPSLDLDFGQDYLLFLDAEESNLHDPALRAKRPGLRQSFAYADVQGAMPMQQGKFRDTFGAHKSADDALAGIAKFSAQPALTPRGTIWIPTLDAAKDLVAPKAITTFTPNPTRAGTIVVGDFLNIVGTGFGGVASNVFYRNADSGGSNFTASGVASDNVTWTDVAVTNKVASEAGTGQIMVNGFTSAGNLTVEWAHTDINSDFSGFGTTTRQRFYLRNLNGTGGMSLRYNTGSGFAGNAAAVASFERALSSWRCAAGVNFAPGGTTANGLANDGVNVVLFDGSLTVGVLGQAVSNFLGSANGSCNLQNSVWWLNDLDVRMRTDPPSPGFPWEFGPAAPSGSEFDFESVAVHEVGHGLGLGHRIAVGQTMHFNIAAGVSARTPAALEITGAQNKMSYSTAATCFNPANSGTPMTAVAPGSCNLAGPGVNIFLDGFE